MKQHAPELVSTKLRALEGQRVKITLRDGSCLNDYEVVSAPRSRVHTLWLFGRGVDVFVAADDIYAADGTNAVKLSTARLSTAQRCKQSSAPASFKTGALPCVR
jgi:hypothetical protein